MTMRLRSTFAIGAFLFCVFTARWQASNAQTSSITAEQSLIDLPTTLRLAGAQNLDIQIAREKLNEARANYSSAVSQFFPSVSPSVTYRRHDNLIQDVVGNIIDVHKQSYALGGTLGSQLDLGDAIYRRLAAKQLARSADHAVEGQRQETIFQAAQAYFDLALNQAAIAVARDAVRIATNYEAQVEAAVEAGIAFKGDQLRVRVQSERNQLSLRQAVEQQRIAAARLGQTLHLDPAVELVAQGELTPLLLVETNQALGALVQHALVSRPELKQSASLVGAARESRNGVVYGPLIPSLGAQAFVGGLGGGLNGAAGAFGEQEDYVVGLSWRIGPGGLFDTSRKRATEARLQGARLSSEKLHDEISRQVVEAFARVQSMTDQITIATRALKAAEDGLRLAQARREFAVGIVLETIQTEQDLTRARNDYFKTVAEFNKAQYALNKALGKL